MQPALGVLSTSNSAAPAGSLWIEGWSIHWANGSTEYWMKPKLVFGEAGSKSSLNDGSWSSVSLDSSNFDSTPVVLTTTTTVGGGQDPSDAQIRGVSQSGFDTRHCEWNGGNGCDSHATETNSWIAIDPSKAGNIDGLKAGTTSVQDSNSTSVSFSTSFSNTPYVFAQVQTDNGQDSKNVRAKSVSSSGFTIDFCEQGSTDGCDSSHASETVGWVAIDPNVMSKMGVFDWGTTSVSDSNWNSVSFSQSYSSSPAIDVMVQTKAGASPAVYPEAKSLSSSGASVRYCEGEGDDTCDSHATETVAWLTAKKGVLKRTGDSETVGSSSGPNGALWVEGSYLHWIDEGSTERRVKGFTKIPNYAHGLGEVRRIRIADQDGDGYEEGVVATKNGIQWFDDNFSTVTNLSTSGGWQIGLFADYDNDGKKEICGHRDHNSNDGEDIFAWQPGGTQDNSRTTSRYASIMKAGDFNSNDNGEECWFPEHGNGAGGHSYGPNQGWGHRGNSDVTVYDWNGDGNEELVYLEGDSDSVDFLNETGNVQKTADTPYTDTRGPEPADYDGDGNMELVVDNGGSSLEWDYNNEPSQSLALIEDGQSVSWSKDYGFDFTHPAVAVDFNGDGTHKIVLANDNNNWVKYVNASDGSVIKTVNTDISPDAVASNGEKLFIGSSGGKIEELDSSGNVIRTFSAGSVGGLGPHTALTVSDNHVYWGGGNNIYRASLSNSASTENAGKMWMESGGDLHYFSENGAEREIVANNESSGYIFRDSFEDGDYTDNWVDTSQSSHSPSVNTNRAYNGSYSLDLPSSAGGTTLNEVRSKDSWSGTKSFSAYLNKYNDGGNQNTWMFQINGTNGEELRLTGSGYNNWGVDLVERDSSGNQLNSWDIRSEISANTWYKTNISIEGPNTVTATIGSSSITVDPQKDWTSGSNEIEMNCNGWGSGSDIDCAYDEVIVN